MSNPIKAPRRSPRSARARPTRTRRSARSSPRPWTRSARTASSPSRRASPSKPSRPRRGHAVRQGLPLPHFVTDNAEMEADLEKPYILIHEKKISHRQGHPPHPRQGRRIRRPSSSSPRTSTAKRSRPSSSTSSAAPQVAAVKAPGFGDRRKAMLEDIATLTGGTAIMEELGIDLEKLELSDLGRAKKVTVDKDNTTIVEGAGNATTSRPHRDDPRIQIEAPPTTTARSSRSASPSSPAASPRSTSAPPPRSR